MNEFSRFRERESNESREEMNHRQEGSTQAAREFANVEEMLRHDREQNRLPREVAERVNESIRKEPQPKRSWWQKIFRWE